MTPLGRWRARFRVQRLVRAMRRTGYVTPSKRIRTELRRNNGL